MIKKKKVKKKTARKKKIVKKRLLKKSAKKTVKKSKPKLIASKKKRVLKEKKRLKKTTLPQETSMQEIGVVTHYFPQVEAAVVKLTKGHLSLGDTIIVKGHTTDFQEKVDSIQLDHSPIDTASVGQEIGLKVKDKVREHDIVYKTIL